MHSIVTSVFGAILFYFLIPGVLVRLPPKCSNFTVSVFHALVFGIIFYLAHRSVYKFFNPYARFEGMKEGAGGTGDGKSGKK
jgi:hypothetical protein